jgi:hypothetical protein
MIHFRNDGAALDCTAISCHELFSLIQSDRTRLVSSTSLLPKFGLMDKKLKFVTQDTVQCVYIFIKHRGITQILHSLDF